MSLLDGAKTSVLVQAYSFTSLPIAEALTRARRRGVAVRVLVDRSNEHDAHSRVYELAAGGAEVWIDGEHPIAHNKVLIVDGEIVETGSFNFTKQAETANAENIVVLRDVSLASAYTHNWEAHQQHAKPLGVPEAPRDGKNVRQGPSP